MYLLDTNICIYAVKNRYPEINNKLFELPISKVYLSVITLHELEYGVQKSRWTERSRQLLESAFASFPCLTFEPKDALLAGRLRANLETAGTPIGAYDLFLAAQALNHNLTLVTHNTSEFARIPDLKIEDWVQP